MVAGALITAAGVFWLSRMPVHGSFLSDLLPGMLLVAVGIGPMFVAVATAANAGVPPDKAGLAAALLNASQQLGGALGLAIFTAIATSRTHHLLATHTQSARAIVSGFGDALLVDSVFLAAAAVIGLRATNVRAEGEQPQVAPGPEPALA
jgi:MFS family permease